MSGGHHAHGQIVSLRPGDTDRRGRANSLVSLDWETDCAQRRTIRSARTAARRSFG